MLEDHPKSCLVNVTAVLEISFASFLKESRLYLTEPLLMHFGKCKDILIIFHHFEGKKNSIIKQSKSVIVFHINLCTVLFTYSVVFKDKEEF